ncbi:MAG: His/Gly/Thr/Pro-type tRNA ligase C-terminal domain-containing protein [archaeon]|nr:His/Gly/Thr/Pro-type tRNA ligase C-terminal domain-containing protein [archaeon]
MYPSYAKWINSHRDLPLLLNQWTNIVRWEFKCPTPFIRSREFLWQEGHTCHATKELAAVMVDDALEWYRQAYEELLCVPVIKGTKTENEKFAGGLYTTTVETIIPTNGKGVQCATSHHLGQNFSKMFNITFLDKDKVKQFAWQTSWGFTTRSIGVMIMMHSDNSGLVLPPLVSPIQVIIIPIMKSKDDNKAIKEKGEEMFNNLRKEGIRVELDDNENHTPGWKYANWELKGVPIRIEYGQKDLSKDQVTFFIRDTKEKFTVPLKEVVSKIKSNLDEMQKRLFENRKKELEGKKTKAYNFDEFLKGMNAGNMVFTPWCNDSKCEDDVKAKVKEIAAQESAEDTVGTCKTLCIPKEQRPIKEGEKCFFCGKDAKVIVIWRRSY